MSSYYHSKKKGKQKIGPKSEKEKEKYAPTKLKEDAVAYLSMVVDKYPESKYRPDAEKTLATLRSAQ